ncbi:GH3 auxin-responsive promoter family protein [Halalkalibaculum sp. DA384]|uniref:GH3 family domain-containing protein n=1 Tax=Halalkalibaculum sp. DA384 TaxID=3373606 RepID=UPI0037552C37
MLSVKEQQLQILFSLLSRGKRTRYGRQHAFDKIEGYQDFCTRLPISFYSDIEDKIEAVKQGAPDLLWPGTTNRFAVSAGTTGKGKHLPLSDERLKSDCRFMRSVAFSYLKNWNRIPSVLGKHLSLPGTVERRDHLLIGEISGFTALHSPWWLRPFHLKPPAELTRLPFKQKFETVLEAALESDIKVIVAVPSWILTLFQQALDRTGKQKVSEIWPNLALLICGGVKLSNYQPHLEQLYGKKASPLDFIETYGSSEGYFAYADTPNNEDMKLVYDNGIFYEFVPDPLPEMESLSIQPTIPLWQAEPNRPYAMLVTTNAGLWRYAVNDIVEFTSVTPPRISVMGRLSEMLDDFGEALHLYEAEQVLNETAGRMEIGTCSFTVGSSITSEQELPRHHWFVQFVEPQHKQTLERLARAVDQSLQEKNRHYAIRRESGALGRPVIRSITQQEINSWLDQQDNSSAQSKLPKLLKKREDIDFFLHQ